MKKIKKDHWYIKENELSISLLKFHVTIDVLKNDDYIFYHVTVVDENRKELKYNFYTLEDVFYFVENVVDKCWSREEIIDSYNNLLLEGKWKEPTDNIKVENNVFFMNPDEVNQAIINFYSEGKDYKVTVETELLLNDEPEITFYRIDHYNDDGIKKDVATKLTDADLKYIFNNMLKQTNYEVQDFKYIGGVHRVGYYFDQDTPYFEGIKIEVKEKELSKQKTL
ncbi:MAG: hypothetical protein IJG68_03800 [Bacilli bacterium]|nr:hypothetical protein [Bacilli bacterium]